MTIIHKADTKKGNAPARTAAAPEMDRTVANCLCCGKVYDCRESSSNDVRIFVGGVLSLALTQEAALHKSAVCLASFPQASRSLLAQRQHVP